MPTDSQMAQAGPSTAPASAAADGALTLFTIGHSTRPLSELVSMLKDAGVRVLVDVRHFPGSRTSPQVSRVPS